MFNNNYTGKPTRGLVASYPLDGNANASVGTNGTATNVTWVKTDKGYQNQCGSFNGSSSYVSTNYSVSNFAGTQNFTFASWIKTSDVGNQKTIFGGANASENFNDLVGMQKTSTNKLRLIRKEGSPSVSYKSIDSTTSINTGKWFFCVGTYDGNNLKVYINGTLEGTIASTGSVIVESGNIPNLRIGRNGDYSPNFLYWSGELELNRIYNVALTEDEIRNLYLEGQRQLGAYSSPSYPALLSGLVGYWDFRGDASNLVDGVKGTVSGATLTTDRFGNSNSAYSFDGVGDYIRSSATTGLTPNTINYWIKINTNPTSGSRYILHYLRDNVNSGVGRNLSKLHYVNTGGTLSLRQSNSSDSVYTATNNINLGDGIWHLVTLTLETLGGTQKTYVDGVLLGNTGTQGTALSGVTTPTLFSLGENSDGSSPYVGILSDVSILPKALSADEVKALYELTSKDYIYPSKVYDLPNLRNGLVLDLDSNGKDLSGNGNNGTLVNGPSLVRQGRSKGLSYNGSNQYILLTNNNDLKPNSTKPIYFSCGIKTTQSPVSYGMIYSIYENNIPSNSSGFIAINDTGVIVLSGNGTNVIISSISVNDGKYHNIDVKLGTSAEIWIDGILRGSGSLNMNTGYSTREPILGNVLYGSGSPQFYYSGQIFKPRIYNRELPAKEKQALYYSQKGNFIY